MPEHMSADENDAPTISTTGHAWAKGRCVNRGAEAPRRWAETCRTPGVAAALSLALRQAARDHLRLGEGDYWPSELAASQATFLLDAGWRVIPPVKGDDASAPLPSLSTRDALAKVLLLVQHPENPDAPLPMVRAGCAGILADALIASGAVIDATALADDEALVERLTAGFWDAVHALGTFDGLSRMSRDVLADFMHGALAAALSERDA